MLDGKKVVFTGFQPSGSLTIGNYLGALKNLSKYEEDGFLPLYCVADMHAITVRQVPSELRGRIYDVLALYIALGLDVEKSILFVQSQVPAHAEMAWILNCFTMFGELSRMTQFKDKSAKHSDNVNAGLFTYPSLMAADILLYQTDLVPVGADQKQHVELARNIANRINQIFPALLTIPEPFTPDTGAKIMSLQDPSKKMSKSDENENAVVRILDDKDTIMRKFRRAVTDSETTVRRAANKAGINNLMNIYSGFTGKSDEEIEKEFAGVGYGEFKTAAGEVCAEALRPLRERFSELRRNVKFLEEQMKTGAARAAYYARKTLSKTKKKLGFVL